MSETGSHLAEILVVELFDVLFGVGLALEVYGNIFAAAECPASNFSYAVGDINTLKRGAAGESIFTYCFQPRRELYFRQ